MTLEQATPFIVMVIMSGITIGLAKWTRGTGKTDKELERLEECKVDVSDCVERHGHIQNFKTRIGKESDDHRNSITKLEKGMIFLVKEQGGDPHAMGLMD